MIPFFKRFPKKDIKKQCPAIFGKRPDTVYAAYSVTELFAVVENLHNAAGKTLILCDFLGCIFTALLGDVIVTTTSLKSDKNVLGSNIAVGFQTIKRCVKSAFCQRNISFAAIADQTDKLISVLVIFQKKLQSKNFGESSLKRNKSIVHFCVLQTII